MKNKFINSVLFMLLMSINVDAQIEFPKFKFTKDSPFGCCPTRKALDLKVKNTSRKRIKKFSIHYSGVNEINEAICSDIVGGVNANVKHTKYKVINYTGPIEVGETQSSWTRGVFYSPVKVIAFPRSIDITYMDNTTDTIHITKDNIATYFPKIKWIDVDYVNGFQPIN